MKNHIANPQPFSTVKPSDHDDKSLSLTPAGVSVVSLDKNLEINHIPARVGDNVEIKCDVTGTPPPPLVWRRYGADLEALSEPEVRTQETSTYTDTYCIVYM